MNMLFLPDCAFYSLRIQEYTGYIPVSITSITIFNSGYHSTGRFIVTYVGLLEAALR